MVASDLMVVRPRRGESILSQSRIGQAGGDYEWLVAYDGRVYGDRFRVFLC